MNVVKITRRIEFDAGHRHYPPVGKCGEPHGHRFVLECGLSGRVPDGGMFMDLADLKAIMMREVGDKWDHAFLVCEQDREMREALTLIKSKRAIITSGSPTIETLVHVAAHSIVNALPPDLGVTLMDTRLYETPNNFADYVLYRSLGNRWLGQ